MSSPVDGVLDFTRLDTTPGARSPFAPPADFAGDADAYRIYLREGYQRDPALRQRLVSAAWQRRCARRGDADPIDAVGPFAPVLEEVLTVLG